MKSSILFALLTYATCFLGQAQDFEYSFLEEYPSSEPYKLKISTYDGNIKVTPSKNNKVQVFYIVKKNNRLLEVSRDELEELVDLNVESSNNSLSISVKNENPFTNWMESHYVSFVVYVPENTTTDLKSSDGNIFIGGLSGDQILRSSDGNIKVENIAGLVDVKTSDGNIKLEKVKGESSSVTSDGNIYLYDMVGKAKTRTSDGNIKMENIDGSTVAITSDGNINAVNVFGESMEARTSDGRIALENVKGNFQLKTSDGSIFFEDASGAMEAITSDGDIRGNMKALTGSLILRTGDGNISVVIPGELGLDLNIKGENINMPELQNFTGRADNDLIQGKINNGGILVDLSTSDGSISLTY